MLRLQSLRYMRYASTIQPKGPSEIPLKKIYRCTLEIPGQSPIVLRESPNLDNVPLHEIFSISVRDLEKLWKLEAEARKTSDY
jgi:hypothetical protein